MLDGEPFALVAQRSKLLLYPILPIFAVYSGPCRRDVEKARNLGVNDVIYRSISPNIIMKKLANAVEAPRSFIAAPDFFFFGPGRRFKARSVFGMSYRELAVEFGRDRSTVHHACHCIDAMREKNPEFDSTLRWMESLLSKATGRQ